MIVWIIIFTYLSQSLRWWLQISPKTVISINPVLVHTLPWFFDIFRYILVNRLWRIQNILTEASYWTPRWTSRRPSSGTLARSVYCVLMWAKVIYLHLLVVHHINLELLQPPLIYFFLKIEYNNIILPYM